MSALLRDETLHLKFEGGGYPIHFRQGALTELAGRISALTRSDRVCIITDTRVAGLHTEDLAFAVRQMGPEVQVVTCAEGEQHKNAETVQQLYGDLLRFGVDRGTPVVALGGGVVGDLAGFVAATLLRGMPLVQVPTTVLSQVDSSVGGKTGYNHPLGKNLIGAFYRPSFVFIDTDYLSTLEPRQVKSGLAEVIKHAVIADPSALDDIEALALSLRAGDPDALGRVIRPSVKIKAEVVRTDELEGGRRAILNFGHTLGHAIEASAGYGALTHGEAVALGMVFATRLSEHLKLLEGGFAERLERVLRACDLPVNWRQWIQSPVLEKIRLDKKRRGTSLRMVLLTAPGQPLLYDCPVDELIRMARLLAQT
ncbi:MAG: 3-dehydroquinate synthase [Bradymonadia bacterium]